jgi:hypothetical protein
MEGSISKDQLLALLYRMTSGMGIAPGSAGMMSNNNGQQYPYIDPQTYWLIAGVQASNYSLALLLTVTLISLSFS